MALGAVLARGLVEVATFHILQAPAVFLPPSCVCAVPSPRAAISHPPLDLSSCMDKKQRTGLFLLQIAVSVGLLTYLFWSIDDEDDPATLISNISDWNFLTAFWLAAALLLTFLSFIIGTLRWESAVDALGINVGATGARQSFRRLFPHFMAGQFMSNFLPTTIGGDILRVSRLNRTAKDAPKSFASVVIDRLGGWVALPIICLVGLGWNQGLRELGAPTRTAFVVAVSTLAVLALVVYLMGHNITGRWLGRRRGMLRYMHALHLGFDGFKSKPRDALYLVLSALLYQFALVLAVGCAAEAFGVDEIGLTAVMAFLPVVLIIQALPISIGGLGVREGLFVFFFTKLGVSDAEATLLGLFLGAMVLVCSLIGVWPLVFGGRRGRRGDGSGGEDGRLDRHTDVTQEMQDTLEELDAMDLGSQVAEAGHWASARHGVPARHGALTRHGAPARG